MADNDREEPAQKIASALASRMAEDFPDARIFVDDFYTPRLHVRAQTGERGCEMYCFQQRPLSAPSEISCYLYLDEEGERVATALTRNLDQLHSCVAAWVGEKLPLQSLREEIDFIERHRTLRGPQPFVPPRVLANETRQFRSYLAQTVNRALSQTGLKIQDAIEEISNIAPDGALWIHGGERACGLWPAIRDACVTCKFMEGDTVLAVCIFADWDAAARGVHLWLGRETSFPALFEAITDMQIRDIAEVFELSVQARLCWLNLIRKARKHFHSETHVPILERFCNTPEIGRFFAYTSMELIRFSRCSHHPPSLAGMPEVAPTPMGYTARCGDEKIEGNIDQTVDFVARYLQNQSRQPFVGCADDLIFEPLNDCLAEQGSTVRLERVSKGFSGEILARRGDRDCRLSFQERQELPYVLWPRAGSHGFGFVEFRELAGTAAALGMWLEQSCEFEDIIAIADNFSHPDYARPDIGGPN